MNTSSTLPHLGGIRALWPLRNGPPLHNLLLVLGRIIS